MEKLTKNQKKELRKFENQKKQDFQKRNDLFKKAAIWGGAVLILALSVWGLVSLSSSTPNSTSQITAPPISKNDITIGTPSAKVSLVEYSDFQCPACAAYHPIVNQLLSEFSGKIIFAYRFFPLSQVHQNAMTSAQAAYAAYKQGKFTDMYNMLFDNQNSWKTDNGAQELFIGYAQKIGLDRDKFKKDMNSDEAKNFITNSYRQGTDIGVNSTPTFFLGGKKIESPGTYDNFKKLIQDEINKK